MSKLVFIYKYPSNPQKIQVLEQKAGAYLLHFTERLRELRKDAQLLRAGQNIIRNLGVHQLFLSGFDVLFDLSPLNSQLLSEKKYQGFYAKMTQFLIYFCQDNPLNQRAILPYFERFAALPEFSGKLDKLLSIVLRATIDERSIRYHISWIMEKISEQLEVE